VFFEHLVAINAAIVSPRHKFAFNFSKTLNSADTKIYGCRALSVQFCSRANTDS